MYQRDSTPVLPNCPSAALAVGQLLTRATAAQQRYRGSEARGESREPRGVEEAGCKIYSCAPIVSQTTG